MFRIKPQNVTLEQATDFNCTVNSFMTMMTHILLTAEIDGET